MHYRSFWIRPSLLALGALASACAPEMPQDPAMMAQRAALLAKNAGLQTAVGTGFAGAQNSTLRRVSSALEMAKKDLGAALPSPLPSPLLDVLAKNSFFQTLFDAKSPLTLEQKLNDVSIQLERWVRERLLAAPNLETKGESEATYLLKADPTCRPLVAPGVTPPAPDAECADRLEKIQVRVFMKALLDGISLRFVVGPERLEVSSILLRLDGLEWRADLGKSAKATEYVNLTLGEGADRPKFSKLAGKTVINIVKDATSGVNITIAVEEALEVAKVDAAGKPAGSLTLASSPTPVVAISGDGARQTLVLQLGLGAMEVKTSWNPSGTAAPNADHVMTLGGLSARGRLYEAARELRLTEVAITDYAESVRGVPTATVAFNADAGGKFDATVKLDATNMPHIEVTPKLEISGKFSMAGLAADFMAPKPYLPDETFRAVLDGAGTPARVQLLAQGGQFAGLAVQAGSLVISRTKGKAPVSTPTGKCLTRSKTQPAADAHPLLGLLAVVDCPRTTMGGTK